MKNFASAFLLYWLSIFSIPAMAREGMWLPFLLGGFNEMEMQSMGMKMSAEDIYSINRSSLKDAVVQFGGGCTGEIISDRGLLLTNHHCGYSYIQALSSLENNFLDKGFWAMHDTLELPCKGLTATFIIEIRDVSRIIRSATDSITDVIQREKQIKSICDSLEKSTTAGTNYTAQVRPIYYGNEYILILSEVYRDIRLVGTPPNSIGNFGGDTDNWIWPRHTGDFSVFRIYASRDNKPASYSEENVPYKPRHFFPVNISGVKEGDFTMVFGFPGKTQSYLPSMGLQMIYDQTNPNRINIRDERLAIWNNAMQANDTIRLQYASKYRGLSNHYKKWKGENQGLKKNDAIVKKRVEEFEFNSWVQQDPQRAKSYGGILPGFIKAYDEGRVYSKAQDYYQEALSGIELLTFAVKFRDLYETLSKPDFDTAQLNKQVLRLKNDAKDFFRNYNASTDNRIMRAMLKLTANSLEDYLLPSELQKLKFSSSKNTKVYENYSDKIFSTSFLCNESRTMDFLNNVSAKSLRKLEADPVWVLSRDVQMAFKNQITPALNQFQQDLGQLMKTYMQAKIEKQAGKKTLYPDANSTLRVSYGKVEGMTPRDGMRYDYFTTLDGVMEKADSSNEEFIIPTKLKELYMKKDFGKYASNGTVPVAFLASNHTTGGNSGSPVINAKGELIGTNFDRIWEGVLSDLYFDGDLSRNISVDVRYTLFIIEKLGGAERLIREMKLVTD